MGVEDVKGAWGEACSPRSTELNLGKENKLLHV